MNLALVLERFGEGGTGGYAWRLAEGLVARGHQVVVFAAQHAEAPRGVEVRTLRVAVRGGPLRVAALRRASRRIDRSGFDVVQGFGRTTGHDVFRAGGGAHAAWLAARDAAMPHLAALRAPLDWTELALDRAAVHEARVVIANSQMAARDLVRCYAARDVRVVRNGVDLVRFRPDPLARADVRARLGAHGRVALFIGHGFRRKGLAVAASAFERVARAEDRLVIAGRDAHAERHLRPILARLRERVVVVGPVTATERWYAAADAVILPTLYDAAANTTLEGLACGVPAVTSTRDGNAELLPSALVAEPGDIDGFARALDAAWTGSHSGSTRAIAEQWPDSRNVAAMESVYREIST